MRAAAAAVADLAAVEEVEAAAASTTFTSLFNFPVGVLMPTTSSTKNFFLPAGLLMAAALALAAPAARAENETKAQTFGSAQEAVDALITAVKAGNVDGIVQVLGPDGREL